MLVQSVLVNVSPVKETLANDQNFNLQVITTIAQDLGYQIIKEASHQFSPQGFTSVLLLQESHIAVHSWPEKKTVIISLLTCKPFLPTDKKKLKMLVERYYLLSEPEIKIL